MRGALVLPLVASAVLVVTTSAAQAPDDDDVEIDAAPAAPGAPTPEPISPAPGAAPGDRGPAPVPVPVPRAVPPVPGAAPAPAPGADVVELRDELAALRAKVEALEVAREGEAKAAPRGEPDVVDGLGGRWLGTAALRLSGYVQAQVEWHDDSEDQLLQGGAPLNQDRFLVRRGRLRLDGAWEYTAFTLEIDGNTTRGPSFSARRAEATLLYRGPWGPPPEDLAALEGEGAPPLVAVTAGITEIPFGHELRWGARDRAFMERSAASLALFPSEPDVGIRVWGGARFFRYDLAVLNGAPLDERAGSGGREFDAAKDLVGRLGVDVRPHDVIRVAGGVSALTGQGFHPGQEATKDAAQWNDANENGSIDAGEVTANPGVSATPSLSFDRWAVGADLRVHVTTPLGEALVHGELTLAENLDRGFFVADPIVTGVDLREVGWVVGLLQEISPYALVGVRVDSYDPNADALDARGGRLLPTAQTVRTISPIVGGVLPGRAKLLFQLDHVTDGLARDEVGVPTDLANDRFTARLQVQL